MDGERLRAGRRWGMHASTPGSGSIVLHCVLAVCASAQGHLRIGMTANDVPLTWGQPDNGLEGYRFSGLLLYDALINWDLTAPDKPSGLIPGLAESWEVDTATRPNGSSNCAKA